MCRILRCHGKVRIFTVVLNLTPFIRFAFHVTRCVDMFFVFKECAMLVAIQTFMSFAGLFVFEVRLPIP